MATNRVLETADAVIDALGGNAAFLKLINQGKPPVARDQQHASNYRSTNRLPHDTYLIVTNALANLGLSARSSLWGIREPAKARAAA